MLDDETYQQWRSNAKKRSELIRAAVIERLRSAREASDLSNRQLSISSGLSRSTIRNIESGSQSPTIETLILLAEGLDVDLPQIIKDEIERKPRLTAPSAG